MFQISKTYTFSAKSTSSNDPKIWLWLLFANNVLRFSLHEFRDVTCLNCRQFVCKDGYIAHPQSFPQMVQRGNSYLKLQILHNHTSSSWDAWTQKFKNPKNSNRTQTCTRTVISIFSFFFRPVSCSVIYLLFHFSFVLPDSIFSSNLQFYDKSMLYFLLSKKNINCCLCIEKLKYYFSVVGENITFI